MMEEEGFLTNIDTVVLFFRACRRYGIQDKKDRVCLMRELTRRRKATYLRDIRPALVGKKVLKIIPKEKL